MRMLTLPRGLERAMTFWSPTASHQLERRNMSVLPPFSLNRIWWRKRHLPSLTSLLPPGHYTKPEKCNNPEYSRDSHILVPSKLLIESQKCISHFCQQRQDVLPWSISTTFQHRSVPHQISFPQLELVEVTDVWNPQPISCLVVSHDSGSSQVSKKWHPNLFYIKCKSKKMLKFCLVAPVACTDWSTVPIAIFSAPVKPLSCSQYWVVLMLGCWPVVNCSRVSTAPHVDMHSEESCGRTSPALLDLGRETHGDAQKHRAKHRQLGVTPTDWSEG